MPNYRVEKYTSQHRHKWDAFIAEAKNATFLFARDFMEYHSHRFTDFSLMVYKDDQLYAVLPANIAANTAIELSQAIEAEALGFDAAFDANQKDLTKHHIDEFFRICPDGTLYLIPTDQTSAKPFFPLARTTNPHIPVASRLG